MWKYVIIGMLLFIWRTDGFAQQPRELISLDKDWFTVMSEQDTLQYPDFHQIDYKPTQDWKAVHIPHNWDQYAGYRRLLHGNLHGFAWYRRTFSVHQPEEGKRFYLFFEGVGSYATVWLNGKRVGYHAGGRTTFTLDVTEAIWTDGRENLLAVRADHPAEIRDLPWVDGGCSPERGFSEGSQPMGIFRPVSLIVKNDVNIIPFGVHYWNDENITSEKATIHHTVELKNTTARKRTLNIVTNIRNREGELVASGNRDKTVDPYQEELVRLGELPVANPHLWSPESPYLYSIETMLMEDGHVLDREETPYGIRKISWPKGLKPNGTNQLFVNDQPVFIHGIAEYEHKLGNSHAFDEEEIYARVSDMKSLGFNSFRDAHQPHNLRYQQYWDENGILLWTQMAAHIWFDNEEFRHNFKTLLKDWVRERRNSPSVFLWGIQNESTLPEDFTRECTALIRSLDPTASIQRLVTTCNGGSGTDWDVPQNWTGTYGGDHATYGEDLKRQVLVGEYGAWRTLELHTEPPYLPNHPVYSEDRFTDIMQTKIRLADSVKDETIGHYMWLWNSHDNPGRVQGGEGFRDLDKIGPVNYKGLLTPWGEPTDAYFMYRAHYAPKEDPMVYIASHTWPHRWTNAGVKNDIRIFSNCAEVELYNDVQSLSLGKQTHPGRGKHFEFNDVDIRYNVLYAEGRNDGVVVARDTIVLFNLEESPNFAQLVDETSTLLQGDESLSYIYRVNCGGNRYTDRFEQHWMADQPYTEKTGWGSTSWTDDYAGINPYFASQRRTFDPIKGVGDWPLFQTFRYGLDKLSYEFDVEPGDYVVELYFSEPWIGTGGVKDAEGRRLFDIAINGEVVEERLDIWNEVGHDHALKKVYKIRADRNKIKIHVPRVYAGQAVIQAIAIATAPSNGHQAVTDQRHFNLIHQDDRPIALQSWMDIGQVYDPENRYSFQYIAPFLYGSDYFQSSKNQEHRVSFAFPTNFYVISPEELTGYENTGDSVVNNEGTVFSVYRKLLKADEAFTFRGDQHLLYAFQVQSGLQPAYDLKKTDSYRANETAIYEHVQRVNFQGQARLQFAQDQGSMVGWQIQVGVADIYALTFKYHNATSETKYGYYDVVALDGAVLKPKTKVSFEPTREGKWNYLDENTTTMINAGTYLVRLYADGAKGVYVDNLDVQ